MNEMTPNDPMVTTDGSVENTRSIWSIMMGVFSSPTQAFADYARKPQIWIPLLVTVVIVVISTLPVVEHAAKMQYEMMKTSTDLPPAALEQMRADAENPNLATSLLGPAFGIIFAVLVSTLVAWFIGGFIFGGQSRFKPIFGVTLLGSLISVVGGLVRVPLVLAKESMYVSIGLAAMMPGKDFTSMLYSFLYYLDFFAIWSIIVTGFGYAIIFGLSRNKGIAISAVSSLLIVVIMIGMTSLFISMGGVKISFF